MTPCKYCKQLIMLVDTCPCPVYKVWKEDESELSGRIINHSVSFRHAAEKFMNRINGINDGDQFHLNVRNFRGEVKRITIVASVHVELETEEEEEVA